MSFGETLRQLREQANLTQAGLAQRSGVPLRTIQGWEQGYRCPVSPDFFKLVRALGTGADVFADPVIKGEKDPGKPTKSPRKPGGANKAPGRRKEK
jgi:transcriptional regulator with XRE-family HTH domain